MLLLPQARTANKQEPTAQRGRAAGADPNDRLTETPRAEAGPAAGPARGGLSVKRPAGSAPARGRVQVAQGSPLLDDSCCTWALECLTALLWDA